MPLSLMSLVSFVFLGLKVDCSLHGYSTICISWVITCVKLPVWKLLNKDGRDFHAASLCGKPKQRSQKR